MSGKITKAQAATLDGQPPDSFHNTLLVMSVLYPWPDIVSTPSSLLFEP
jgi:hypothetical protein